MTIKFFARAEDPADHDLKEFFNHLDLILRHQDFILATPELSRIHLKGCGAFPLYVSSISLTVGELLQLWEQTAWRQEDKYFFSITGSPLSGGNSSRYWSRKKGLAHCRTAVFSAQFLAALSLRQTGSPVFGLVTPVDVPPQPFSELTIGDLLAALEAREK